MVFQVNRSRSHVRRDGLHGSEQRIGEWRMIDDRTGFYAWSSEMKREWDNLQCVNPDKRNPQDFVRGVPDRQAVQPVRPQQPDNFLVAPVTPDDL